MSRINGTGVRTVAHSDYLPVEACSHGSIYLKMIKETVDYFNVVADEIGLPVQFGDETIRSFIKAKVPSAIRRFEKNMREEGSCDGMLHRAQIKTGLDIIKSVLDDPTTSKNVVGLMQVGKSGTIDDMHFAGPILFMLTGRPYFPIFLGTNSNGATQQTSDGRQMFMALYQDIDIYVTGEEGEILKSMTLREHETLKPAHFKALHNMLNKKSSIFDYNQDVLEEGRQQMHPKGFMTPEIRDCITQAIKTGSLMMGNFSLSDLANIQRTASKNRITAINALTEILHENGFNVMLVIDEIHWGSQSGGVADRYMGSMFKHFMDENSHHIIIGFSATPYETDGLSRFERIYHAIGKDYCGPRFFKGVRYREYADQILPNVMSFNEVATKLGFNHPLSVAAYHGGAGSNAFSEMVVEGFTGDHDAYKEYFIKALRAIITKHLITDHLGDPRPVALCMRAINNNSADAAIIDALFGDDNPHQIAHDQYNSERRTSPKSFKRWMRESGALDNARRSLITVTSAARMADAFLTRKMIDGESLPLRWIFLDLSIKTSHLSTLLQGFYGRAGGYNKVIDGKPPIVMMSDSNCARMDDFHATLGAPSGSYSKNVKSVGRAISGKAQCNVDIVFDDAANFDPKIAEALTGFSKHISDNLSTTGRNLQGARFGGERTNVCDIWSFFDHDVLTRLSRYVAERQNVIGKVDMLMPRVIADEDAETSVFYTGCTSDGQGIAGFRSLRTQAERTGGNDTSLRNTRRTRVSTHARQPQVHVEYDPITQRWTPKAITLALTSEVRFGSTGVLATGNDSAFCGARGVDDLLNSYEVGQFFPVDGSALIAAGKLTQTDFDEFLARMHERSPRSGRGRRTKPVLVVDQTTVKPARKPRKAALKLVEVTNA